LLAPFPQLKEYSIDNVIPLGMHVVEGAAHEHIDPLPEEGPG